jgi:hypothetical protein
VDYKGSANRKPSLGPSGQPFNAGRSSPYRRSLTGAGRAGSEGPAAIAEIEIAGEYVDRKRLTFEQAEGAEPLPSQLKLKEVSNELRALLWNIFFRELRVDEGGRYLSEPIVTLLYEWHVKRQFKAADEFSPNYLDWVEKLKPVFMEGDYVEIFGFVQWALRHPFKPDQLEIEVDEALRASRAAYALFDRDTIVPIGSDAEREALGRAFADIAASEFHGARAHLRNAGSELTAGNYGPSIRESIHAVEAVARALEPAAQTLGPALSKLENRCACIPRCGTGSPTFTGSPAMKKESATRCWMSRWPKWTRRTRSTCLDHARRSFPT